MRFAALLLIAALLHAAEIPVEKDGRLRVEAENFDRQRLQDVRQWIKVSADGPSNRPQPDPDESNAASASGGAYIEVLPDTRTTHDDKLTHGENFTNEPGKMAIVEYDVEIVYPGRFYVWCEPTRR